MTRTHRLPALGAGIILLLCASACDRKPPPPGGPPVPRPAPGAPASTAAAEQKLIDAVRKAHESKDVEAFIRQVCWDRAGGEESQAMFRQVFEGDAALKIKAIQIVKPLPKDELLEYARDGVTYRPNLTPIGKLRIDFEPNAAGMTDNNTAYLVGMKGDVCMITTAAPVEGNKR